MGKIIFWIVVVFALLFALRLWNAAQGALAVANGRSNRAPGGCGESMVQCARCGVFLPEPDARDNGGRLPLRRSGVRQPRPRWTPFAISIPMQPAPAIPPFEPPPMPSPMGDSGRRILWIVGLYRAICAATLLGAALLLDPRTLNIVNAECVRHRHRTCTSCSACRRSGGSSRTGCRCRCRRCCSALLAGDVFFLSLVMFAGGTFGAPLPILLFPQLAAAGWILRTQTAFLHAAFAAIMPARARRATARCRAWSAARRCSRPASSASATSPPSASRSRWAATPSSRKTWRRSAASTSPTSSRSIASSSRTCRTACWSST